MKRYILILWVLLFLFVFSNVGTAFFDSWSHLRTDHFNIYYTTPLHGIAQQVAAIAEDVHNELTAYLGYEPKRRTALIIYDNVDLANGWASPLWEQRMAIYLTQPELHTMGLAGDYESWLRLVITHEYAHILQLTMPPEEIFPWGWARYLIPPILTQPYWFIEGFATFTETQFTTSGRGDSAMVDSMLNVMAASQSFYHYDQIVGLFDLESWPGAAAVYNYGVRFIQFLEKQYGSGFAARLAQESANNIFTGVSGAFKRLTGDSVTDVYRTWQATLMDADKKEVGVPMGTLITQRWGYNTGAALSPDGRRVVYIHQGEGFPSLRLWSREGDFQLSEAVSLYGGSVSWSGDGRYIAYARLEPGELKDLYHQIYIYDLFTDNQWALTEGRGGSHPAWSPRGEIAYIEKVSGGHRVVSILPSGEGHSVLLPYYPHRSFKGLAWDPTGSYLAVEVLLEGGHQGVWIWEKATERITPLFIAEGNISRIAWSGDGRFLLFTTTAKGKADIFAYEIPTDRFWQVTDAPYGAYEIAMRGRETVYSAMTENGFQLFRMTMNPADWRESTFTLIDPVPVEDWPAVIDYELEPRRYSLFLHLGPRIVLPFPDLGPSLGVFTMGWDPLDLINYELSISTDFESIPAYMLYARIMPDRGYVQVMETLVEGGYYDGDRKDGFLALAQIPLAVDMFGGSGLLLGGGLYYAESVMPQVIAGHYSNRQSAEQNLTLDSSYLALFQGGNMIDGWQVFLEGSTRQAIFPARGTVFSLEAGAGLGLGPVAYSVSIRGYPASFSGDFVFSGSLEAWQRLWKIKRGLGTLPVFFDSFHAGVFMDVCTAYDGQWTNGTGIGGELALDLSLLHGRIPLRISGGVAFNDEQEWSFHVGVGTSALTEFSLKELSLFNGTFFAGE